MCSSVGHFEFMNFNLTISNDKIYMLRINSGVDNFFLYYVFNEI